MTRLLYKRIICLSLTLVAVFTVSATMTAAVGRCKGGYHFVHTPKDAPYSVTACTKLSWKTLVYAFVPDTTTQQPLFITNAPKQKGSVALEVITVEADSLENAVDKYFGGEVPETVTYTSDTKYFNGGDVAIDETSATASLQALGDNLPTPNINNNTNSNTNTTATAKALNTTVYSFDNDNNALYILSVSAKRQKSAFGRQAKKTGESVTVTMNVQ